MKNLNKKLLLIATLASFPMIGLAQPNLNTPGVNVTSINDLFDIITRLVSWVTGLFFVAAVLFLFYAAYLYLTAGGDPETLGKAKNQLIYSIVAIAIALLATSVRTIVEGVLNRTG